MGKTRKKKGKRWDHPDYKKGVYCFERDGYIHTYIFGERLSIKNLPWNKSNKDFAIQVLDKRVREYFERENGFNSNRIDTFSELFIFYKELKFRYVKDTSKATFINNVKRVMQDNDFHLSDHLGITKYINNRIHEMKEVEGYSNSTINNSIQKLRGIFKVAIESNIMTNNPVKSWMKIKDQGYKFTICNREQINLFLTKLNEYRENNISNKSYITASRLYFTILIASITGMRRHELQLISKEDIKENKLIIRGKGDVNRDFPYSIRPELKSVLKEASKFNIEYLNNYKYLLGFRTSNPMGITLENYKKALGLSNLTELKYHAIRKLVENEMMNDYSLNDNLVRTLIGHTIQTQSKHYLNKLSAEEIEEIVKSNNS